jgi:ABC-2 type transport system ATP-binding protein
MLEARKLSKHFNGTAALEDLDLLIPRGEIFCLLGANGAGKTTTINLFLGFLAPTSGSATIDDLDVQKDPLGTKRLLAYIPEQVNLYRNLSGLENLAYFSELSGRKKSQSELLEVLRRVGLDETTARRRLRTYSKGMRQRVGIAIAVAKEARALLLDEPTSGLDPQAANEFAKLLSTLAAEGVAVLMATHDLFRAKEVGHRVGIMKHGRLVETLEVAKIAHLDLESIYLAHMHG